MVLFPLLVTVFTPLQVSLFGLVNPSCYRKSFSRWSRLTSIDLPLSRKENVPSSNRNDRTRSRPKDLEGHFSVGTLGTPSLTYPTPCLRATPTHLRRPTGNLGRLTSLPTLLLLRSRHWRPYWRPYRECPRGRKVLGPGFRLLGPQGSRDPPVTNTNQYIVSHSMSSDPPLDSNRLQKDGDSCSLSVLRRETEIPTTMYDRVLVSPLLDRTFPDDLNVDLWSPVRNREVLLVFLPLCLSPLVDR